MSGRSGDCGAIMTEGLSEYLSKKLVQLSRSVGRMFCFQLPMKYFIVFVTAYEYIIRDGNDVHGFE